MADCPNCGKWNPDDKTICWHCSEPLPKPVPKKPPRKMFMGLPTWTWILLAVMMVIWLATTVFSTNLLR